MKRLYIGVGLLVIMLAAGSWLTARFSRIHLPVNRPLQEARQAALDGDWQQVEEKCRTARENWESVRHFAAAVSDHGLLEQMDGMFSRLEVLARLRQADEFTADCAELCRMAEALAESQRLTWWNLL